MSPTFHRSDDGAPLRRALRHLGAALLAVLTIALAVLLLSLPVAQAQPGPELRIGHQTSASPSVLPNARGPQERRPAARPAKVGA